LQLLEGTASPELGVATTRFVEAERSLGNQPDGSLDRGPSASTGLDHDMLRADAARGEREWLDARREGRCLAVPDDAMAPVVAQGTLVAFAAEGEPPTALDGRMVVARAGGATVIRWFEDRGDHGLLRAEDPQERPVRVELGGDDPVSIRRVLWIGAIR
jgi:hypothetical protein